MFAIRICQEPASFYKPDTLYEYIDGGADVYLLYDFQRLLHQNFRTPGGELTADIYDLGKPENAFGIYSAERSPRYKFVTLAGCDGCESCKLSCRNGVQIGRKIAQLRTLARDKFVC